VVFDDINSPGIDIPPPPIGRVIACLEVAAAREAKRGAMSAGRLDAISTRPTRRRATSAMLPRRAQMSFRSTAVQQIRAISPAAHTPRECVRIKAAPRTASAQAEATDTNRVPPWKRNAKGRKKISKRKLPRPLG